MGTGYGRDSEKKPRNQRTSVETNFRYARALKPILGADVGLGVLLICNEYPNALTKISFT